MKEKKPRERVPVPVLAFLLSRSLFEIGSFLDHSKQIILINAREREGL
jgi:hypothetical protein